MAEQSPDSSIEVWGRTMPLLDELRKNRERILALASECGLKDIRVFGSVARREEDEKSDIDFLVSSTHEGDPLGFLDFKRALAEMTGRKVDICFAAAVYPLWRDEIVNKAVAI
jgi:predicted nucleotidyltransferase